MPGPIAFQTSVFMGHHRAKFLGGCAAAFGIVFPAFALMVLFGTLLESAGDLPAVQPVLTGMQAAALGLILASLKGLFWSHRTKPLFWFVAAIALAITGAMPATEPLVILGCGIATALLFEIQKRATTGTSSKSVSAGRDKIITRSPLARFLLKIKFAWALPLFQGSISVAAGKASILGDLSWACFKAGALVFGSGIAIVPLMEQDFVERLKWLTHAEFMNALAFGQITPGPVVITATFIGYKALGLVGASVATASVFAAPFIHMTTWFPRFVGRLSRLQWITPFLLGAIAAVVGSILAATFRLASPFFSSPALLGLIFVTGLVALSGKLPAWSLIPAAGLLSWLVNVIN
jgi:chromate transporter